MAQEASTQAQTQTVKIRKYFRSTSAGGYDKTFVAKPDGTLIRPIKYRSRTGNHGWDIWNVTPGRYAIVTVSRPNLNGKPKPYSIAVQCVDISNESKIIAERKFFVMDWSLEDVKTWALSICP